VAPFYYPWPVKMAWLNANGEVAVSATLNDDLRKWLPGPFVIEAELRSPALAGTYRLALGIEDPWTGEPAIRFANDLRITRGWTILGQVEVE
jgi:hypothetical protein